MTAARIALVAALMAATCAVAQSRRPGSNEVYFGIVTTESKDYQFEGGTTASTDSGVGFNLGWAHHVSPHVSAGIEIGWMDIDYRARVQPGSGNPNAPDSISGTIETGTLRFVGTYNFLARNFTPFVTGGLGWTYVDTNIPSGLPESFCWYYPWYGSYCGTYVPTESTTKISYNVGAGLRYDFGTGVFRALVEQQFIDFGGSYGSDGMTQFRLELGTKF